MKSYLKIRKVILILSFFCTAAFSQNYKISYCGISSGDIDLNMAKITSDLYYTQLTEIQDFSISDRRADFSYENFDDSLAKGSDITFYVEIKKIENTDRWQTVFYLFNPENKETASVTKDYDSYYKILMEPKSSLQDSIKEMVQSNIRRETGEVTDASQNKDPEFKISTESLSGNWHGEKFINKIVILRGGRGFVIYNNGASMNILIRIEGDKIIVSQNQKSNASYFPDLPRDVALEKALTAEPIIWTFTAEGSDTLNGTKRTLTMNGNSAGYTTTDVCWQRIN